MQFEITAFYYPFIAQPSTTHEFITAKRLSKYGKKCLTGKQKIS